MDRVAALSDAQRSELFEETARARGILPAIIEKDFWVCWVLKKLFAADQLAFDEFHRTLESEGIRSFEVGSASN